jgi:hypothetical protein
MIDRESEHAADFAVLTEADPAWAALTAPERAARWRQYLADALADDAYDAEAEPSFVVVAADDGGATAVWSDGSFTRWPVGDEGREGAPH